MNNTISYIGRLATNTFSKANRFAFNEFSVKIKYFQPYFHNMTKYILLALYVASSTIVSAQATKIDVVVVGNTTEAISAGIQAARSGVKTVLVTEANILNPTLTADDIQILEKIQNHFTFKNKQRSSLKDSLLPSNLNLIQSSKLIKGITDTVKNLKILLNTSIKSIEKSRKGWELKTSTGQELKTQLVIDATQNLTVARMLKIQTDSTLVKIFPQSTLQPQSDKLYRTSAGNGYYILNNVTTKYVIPVGILIPANTENFIAIPRNTKTNFRPVSMSIGQAAGATAAYCAFFNTSTDKLNVRMIQGELLSFEAPLVSFGDIKDNDPNRLALQNIGLTGLLRFNMIKSHNQDQLSFNPDALISASELKLPMKEYYTRSQIWFADNNPEQLTIGNVITLIMYSATRGKELKGEIEKAWKGSFKFSSSFDEKRPITRREFAVLANAYLQPFTRRVDINGNLLK